MTKFFDVNKQEYISLTELSFSHKVNGEKSLKGTIYTNDKVINEIDRGWSLEFQNEIYYITYALPTDTGENVTVEFDAIHEFFYMMGKSAVYEQLNGSNTAKAYLDLIFSGTDYNYSLATSVAAFEKQNFGMKNRLSLFNDFISSTNLEFKIVGKTVTISEKIGSDLSTIVRKGFNMQELGLEHNIGDFVTYAKGFGAFVDPDDESKGRLEAEYRSPLADIYGILEADPLVDERYTQESSIVEKLKELVESSYSISVSLSVEDLQKAGYKYGFPSPGDYILAVNESLNFQQKIRIVSIEENFDVLGNSLDKSVTCNSLSLSSEKEEADAINSQNWTDIINGDKPIPENWLTDAIQNATSALINAQTELKFTNNGILAIDKTDHNKIVIINSAGLGVSTDGGKTFENAITAEGVNASAITTGILKAITIEGVSISGSTFETIGSNGKIMISGGKIQFQDRTGKEFGSFYPVNVNNDSLAMDLNSKSDININAGESVKRTEFSLGHGYSADSPTTSLVGVQVPVWLHYTNGSTVQGGVEVSSEGVYLRGGTNIETYLSVANNSTIDFYSSFDMHGFPMLTQSDIRLKENITATDVDGIEETKKLEFFDFKRKQNYQSKDPKKQPNDSRELGLIAQYSPFLCAESEKDHYLRIDMSKQIMLNSLTNKQLIEKIESLESQMGYRKKNQRKYHKGGLQ